MVDTGATNHISEDFSNLSNLKPYTGSSRIVLGDGTSLPITHVGSACIASSFFWGFFHYKFLSCPSHETKPTLSSSTNPFQCYFLICPYFLKDLQSGKLLAKGVRRCLLYFLQSDARPHSAKRKRIPHNFRKLCVQCATHTR